MQFSEKVRGRHHVQKYHSGNVDPGKAFKYEVCKILHCSNWTEKQKCDVSFLKQYRSTNNQFVKSDVEDTFVTSFCDIVGKLVAPKELRRGVMEFAVDITNGMLDTGTVWYGTVVALVYLAANWLCMVPVHFVVKLLLAFV